MPPEPDIPLQAQSHARVGSLAKVIAAEPVRAGERSWRGLEDHIAIHHLEDQHDS